MWTKIPVIALGVILFTAAVTPATAHSLKNLEARLYDREKYFQPLEKQAPEFEIQDADGRFVRLADFHEKVVVLHFIYASCPDVCPLHAERIANIQQMVNQTPMKDQVQFISVTTDPENDTIEVLRDYGAAHGLDPVNWIFLTSGTDRPTATRELAARFGHKFTKTDEGYQVHGVVTHVIGREGNWRANFHGLKFAPTNLVLFVNALVNDAHRPEQPGKPNFWDRVRKLF